MAVVAVSCASRSDSYIRDRVVKLTGEHAACTGEQVHSRHGANYILTAGHCKNLQDAQGFITAIDASGNRVQRRVIAEDPASDLLLLEGLPGLRGLDIGRSDAPPEHVRTFTHGGGRDTYTTEGMIVQYESTKVGIGAVTNSIEEAACVSAPKYKVEEFNTFFGPVRMCIMSVVESVSTAKIIPGSSGGPVVDDSGALVGVASASGDDFYYFVRLSDIEEFLKGY